MGKQEDIFSESEGDAWFARNFWQMKDQEANDPVIASIESNVYLIHYSSVVEFGCSNGWRLDKLREMYEWYCFGVDPSVSAIANGQARFPKISLQRGTMTGHPFVSHSMNMVIYGFCLYVCDPEELCEIVTQGDNLLADKGYLIIHDFDPEFPHSVPNKHVPGLMTYKMDYSKLWLANPAYKLINKMSLPDQTAVWVLKKDIERGFPCLSGS